MRADAIGNARDEPAGFPDDACSVAVHIGATSKTVAMRIKRQLSNAGTPTSLAWWLGLRQPGNSTVISPRGSENL